MAEARYLFSVAVGPVQEFIASARKLRDLWYGSYLLSELSKAVARYLNENGCELIFPAVVNGKDFEPDSPMSVANKILALTPEDVSPEDMVAGAKSAFMEHWKKLCEKAQRRLPQGTIKDDLFDKQVADFGEFFAAWAVYDENDYSDSRNRVEQKLTGRKSLREFSAPGWDGHGLPKSSLDGIRESVIKNTAPLRKRYALKRGEHLDALGIVKRLGPLTNSQRPFFDNMARVAVQPLLEGLTHDSKARGLLKGFPDLAELYPPGEAQSSAMSAPDFWPPYMPEELLIPAVFEKECKEFKDDGKAGAWDNAWAIIRKILRRAGEPCTYGCLIVGDGDRMGAVLDSLTTICHHKAVSAALDQFARSVHEMVEGFGGRVIYSGGDDVLAYAPLHRALGCAAAVNQAFHEALNEVFNEIGVEQPTFSAGMAIVHYKMPLHLALELARTAEKHAKQKGGRDSLAVVQSKRSGSDLIVCGKWQKQGELPQLYERLQKISRLYRQGKLSSRLGYQLRRVAKESGAELILHDNGDTIRPGNVTAAEAIRIIGRKRTEEDGKLDDQTIRFLLSGRKDLRSLADELIIAHQISKAEEQASAGWLKTGDGA